jgi:SAUR family protein
MGQFDQGNDQHLQIHCSHLRMPSSLHLPHFHLHFPPHHHHHDDGHGSSQEEAHDFHKNVPKGCVAIYVGSEGEEHQRFVIPAVYINHPLFQKLLNEAEEKYGFEQKGAITIPCQISDFQYVQGLIDQQQQHRSHSTGFCIR